MKYFISFLIICAITFSSCRKNNDPFNGKNNAPLALEFDNVAGDEDLELNTGSYTNSSGETYSVTVLQYFISNIKLKKTDGTEYIVPQDSSYFLIDENSGDNRPVINVPEGEYGTLSFTVGVDSLRSTMDLSKRTGVLAPAAATYFSENEGYVFFMLEGNSQQAAQNPYKFHIGGYGGKTAATINNLKEVTLDLTVAGVAKVHTGDTSEVHLIADVNKVFSGTSDISLEQNPIVLFEPYSVSVANNYQQMFRHDHTHN
jgi:hypothetical protein